MPSATQLKFRVVYQLSKLCHTDYWQRRFRRAELSAKRQDIQLLAQHDRPINRTQARYLIYKSLGIVVCISGLIANREIFQSGRQLIPLAIDSPSHEPLLVVFLSHHLQLPSSDQNISKRDRWR
jgi:hypothetical protein